MFDFISAFLDAHYWTVSYALTYTLGTICGLTIISRFVRMFPTYIKTGSMGDDKLGIFFSNRKYEDIHGKDFIRHKVNDFFTATHLETIFFDLVVCFIAILLLHVAWILVIGVGSIVGGVYGIVKFVQHLREQYVKKEEFHTALRGE